MWRLVKTWHLNLERVLTGDPDKGTGEGSRDEHVAIAEDDGDG